MFRNSILVAVRLISRNLFYSLVNILGLATGIACFVLVLLYVKDEYSYESHHRQAGNIYRVCEILNTQGSGENASSVPFPVGPAMLADFPHLVRKQVRFFNFQDSRHTLAAGSRSFNEGDVYFCDSSLFEVFTVPLLRGDTNALKAPRSIILSEALAGKYFGETDPIGKTIRFEGVVDLTVTGVFTEQPAQSHLKFNALISFASLHQMVGKSMQQTWVWNPCWTYILLRSGIKPAQIEQAFPAFVQKHYPDFLKGAVSHYLQALPEIHLNSDLAYEMHPNGDGRLVSILMTTGLFIMLMACINFINLNTARSASRAREIAIRKVLGASRRKIMLQLLAESLLIALLAVSVAVVIIELLLPFMNKLSGKDLSLFGENWRVVILFLSATGLAAGLLSGVYPAFYLSSFEPAQIMRYKALHLRQPISLRKFLVVFQFSIALILICSTLILFRQLEYLRKSTPGFNSGNLILIPIRSPMYNASLRFRTAAERLPFVNSICTMNDVVGKHHNTHEYRYQGMKEGSWVYFPSLLVDEHFIKTMQIKLLAGRDFSTAYPRDDSLSLIINQSMLQRMGWKSPEEALGKPFVTPTGSEKIIGVVQDFHFESLRNPMGPFVLDMPHRWQKPFWVRQMAVRLEKGDFRQQTEILRAIWNKQAAGFPFEFNLLTEELEAQYQDQEKLAGLFAAGAVIAIFLGCLGLLALSAYNASQRTKEIGIRKVLGAGTGSIIRLLSGSFLKLVIIANLLALPITWFLMEYWLNQFAFRIEIPLSALLTGSLLSIIISLGTVVFQAMKAAIGNPVKALRYE